MLFLCKTLLNTCLSIHFVGTYASLVSDDSLRDKIYQRLHATTFGFMLASIDAYDFNIMVFKVAHHADAQKWSDNLTNQSIIQAIEWGGGGHKFILCVIEDTRTHRL